MCGILCIVENRNVDPCREVCGFQMLLDTIIVNNLFQFNGPPALLLQDVYGRPLYLMSACFSLSPYLLSSEIASIFINLLTR